MTEKEKLAIRAIAKALYVRRNRFGSLDGDARSRNEMHDLTKHYKIPHGGRDTVDQAMMLLQAIIGDEPTSILDSVEQSDGTIKPRERKPL